MTEEEQEATAEAAVQNANAIKHQEAAEQDNRHNVYSVREEDDPEQVAPPPFPI